MEYSTPEVAGIVLLSQRKLLSCVERGYVKPSIQDADGHGTSRIWSYTDVIRCAAVGYLLDRLSVNCLRDFAAQMADDRLITPDWIWLLSFNPFHERDAGLSLLRVQHSRQRMLGPSEPTEGSLGPKPIQMDWEQLTTMSPAQLIIDFKLIHDFVQSRL